ncbi:hypothetical protein RFI_17008 [Reticulomyxa filosa]|uniref:Uncharacterized protein n=1 Tax=Reticulomyxa filosa TaxID=46433 RepID=X6N289_RETFI|nr:hypothetical protein RFI_17008 [Reticulomyxa filosa]|eukprot:ETO20211.1 hypothetical protein RFI_17008 [Reticulomyxa filosa]
MDHKYVILGIFIEQIIKSILIVVANSFAKDYQYLWIKVMKKKSDKQLNNSLNYLINRLNVRLNEKQLDFAFEYLIDKLQNKNKNGHCYIAFRELLKVIVMRLNE